MGPRFTHATPVPRWQLGFFDEFERVASLLDVNPGFGTPFELPLRIYPLRVFPYSVIYKPTDQGIRVLTVRHQHRAPAFGQGRS